MAEEWKLPPSSSMSKSLDNKEETTFRSARQKDLREI
jgi:hypothetical protein